MLSLDDARRIIAAACRAISSPAYTAYRIFRGLSPASLAASSYPMRRMTLLSRFLCAGVEPTQCGTWWHGRSKILA